MLGIVISRLQLRMYKMGSPFRGSVLGISVQCTACSGNWGGQQKKWQPKEYLRVNPKWGRCGGGRRGLHDVGHNKYIVLGGRGAFDRSGSLNMHLQEHVTSTFHLQSLKQIKHWNTTPNIKSINSIKKKLEWINQRSTRVFFFLYCLRSWSSG